MGRTHGMSHQRLHNIWLTMRQRCSKPNCSGWHKYGAKGIRVCDEWEHSFEAFRDWAYSHGYDDTLTIDRIDPRGNYEPGNCRWVTQKVQQNNRSNNVKLTYKDETHSVIEWSEISNIPLHILYDRYYRGWNVDRIFEQPIRKSRKRNDVQPTERTVVTSWKGHNYENFSSLRRIPSDNN